MSKPFNVSMSCHGQPSIQLGTDSPVEHHRFLRYCVLDNYTTSPAYQARRPARPFLQGRNDVINSGGNSYTSSTESGHPTWTLVEFWSENYQSFVDWLNEHVESNSDYYKGICRIFF